MSYLVDTNIVSETVKPHPEEKVITWLREHEPELYISAVTIGEIRRGIERLPEGDRKSQLREWLRNLGVRMQGRVLSFNSATAHVWGQLKAKWEASGITVATIDSQIAATAHRYQLTVVTRNVSDFQFTGLRFSILLT